MLVKIMKRISLSIEQIASNIPTANYVGRNQLPLLGAQEQGALS